MVKYTFTFERDAERRFRDVLSRLGEDEYNILEDVKQVDITDRLSDKQAIIEMDPEACLTFRMSMGNHIKIHRERTEEELKEEEELKAKNTIKVTVYTGSGTGTPPAAPTP